jgi:hypothetical protein
VAVVARESFLMNLAIRLCTSEDPAEAACLGYDTSFNGAKGFYHSALACEFTCFDGNPNFIIALYLHSDKKRETHKNFFTTLTNEFPALRAARKIVTDAEDFGLAETLPNTKIFTCHRHFKENLLDQCRQHPTWDKVIVDEILGTTRKKGLIDCTSLEQYEAMLASASERWPAEFLRYFQRHKNAIIKGDILYQYHIEFDIVVRKSILIKNTICR